MLTMAFVVFKFHKRIQSGTTYATNTDHSAENIKEMVNPFSVVEWHCNITDYSYVNHDDYSHLHSHNELLRISFVDNNFHDTPV